MPEENTLPFRRKTEIQITSDPKLTIVVDAEDVESIQAAGPWFADMRSNRPTFYRSHGIKGKEFRETLGAFLLGADFGVFVEFVKSQEPLNYRKANLRVSPRSAVKQKGELHK
jgi:hypothetical protein